jgi:hypothetical protein
MGCLISDADIGFIVTTATTRPDKLGCPFTRWSVRKLAAYLAHSQARRVVIGRERLRQLLGERSERQQRWGRPRTAA